MKPRAGELARQEEVLERVAEMEMAHPSGILGLQFCAKKMWPGQKALFLVGFYVL